MRRHARREPADVDLAAGAIQPNRSLGGGRLALELVVEGIEFFGGVAGSSGVDAFYGDPRTLGISVKTKF